VLGKLAECSVPAVWS